MSTQVCVLNIDLLTDLECRNVGNRKMIFAFLAPPGGLSKESVEEFINNERLVAFPKMTGSGLNDLAGLKKKIVMFVIEDKPEHHTAER